MIEELKKRVINNRRIKDTERKMEIYEDFSKIVELRSKGLRPKYLSNSYLKIEHLIEALLHF